MLQKPYSTVILRFYVVCDVLITKLVAITIFFSFWQQPFCFIVKEWYFKSLIVQYVCFTVPEGFEFTYISQFYPCKPENRFPLGSFCGGVETFLCFAEHVIISNGLLKQRSHLIAIIICAFYSPQKCILLKNKRKLMSFFLFHLVKSMVICN
jgi:hypothetical protein